VVEAAKRPPVLTGRVSTNNKEAAGCVRDLTAADMAVAVFVVDTQRQETAGTAQHQAVAERGTALVLPPSGDKASAPTMPPSAPPMTVWSSLPPPYYICGCGPFYYGGEPSRNVSCSRTIASTFDYG
jgi:hypothetical protein